jgi:sigma-E factor negative regulatory protein RseB
MRMLDQAAGAARRTSYQGVQVLSWRSPGGSGWLRSRASTVTVDVSHRGGAGTGMLGLTPSLVGLLGAHYAVLCAGTGSAGGRPAMIVEALRGDGGVAARFWLDSSTKLPLRRELFDAQARLISDDGFHYLKLGTPAGKPARQQPAAGALNVAVRPWADQLGPARLAALRAGGWPVPRLLPGDLTLFDASASATAGGNVVDLAYSDGLSVVSLFVQRGQLPAGLTGWRQTDLSGNRLYVKNPGEPDVTWSAGGFVFTMVAAAPAPTVAAAVNALPHQAPAGFWGRMKRGAARLASWLNPFR